MPSSFIRLAIDFDGDGRRDIVGSVPDALASTANYLQQSGWRAGEPWGFEVRLPRDFDVSVAGRRNRQTLAHWASLGVRRVDGTGLLPGEPGQGLTKTARAALLVPAGARGPAFLALRNFDAIHAYNAALSYALAIAHLADRLRGGGPFVAGWPTDDPGLSRAQRRELQALLAARGHDIGAIDGLIGERSRAAIRAEETRLELAPSGRAGSRILDALGSASAAARPEPGAKEATR
jgi:glucose-6-phosphate 1-epimerase